MNKGIAIGLSVVPVALCCVLLTAFPEAAQEGGPYPEVLYYPEVLREIKHDVSPPLRDIVPLTPFEGPKRVIPLRLLHPPQVVPTQPDPVLQTSGGPAVGTTAGLNFAGVGDGDYGFVPNAAPPDTNGAVGATQFVQWVNESFAVFNKTTGAIAAGFPKVGNTLWSGFGGGCETNNDGDPIAQYDKAAGRWVLTQFSVSTTPFLQCVAVSTTSDATGPYNRYAFSMPNFPDYPKLGVWPDGYYISFNMFSGNTFVGARACAFDRTAMLAGAAATQQCFQLSSSFGGLLPSDLDGPASPPPTGEPNFFLNFGTNSLNLWKFHVDFTTPAKMYRLAYRNFTTHESLVVNHSVAVGTKHKSPVGVRWYELRAPSGTPTVFQSGTFAPDSNFRWMGSIAMDKVGDIALGYSVSSSSTFPSIRFTGRVPTDPLGTMEAENSIKAGAGSQIGGLNRWGDYSSIAIDPVDDCTFWYTNEYLKTSGSFNWSTQIASFKFPGCI